MLVSKLVLIAAVLIYCSITSKNQSSDDIFSPLLSVVFFLFCFEVALYSLVAQKKTPCLFLLSASSEANIQKLHGVSWQFSVSAISQTGKCQHTLSF